MAAAVVGRWRGAVGCGCLFFLFFSFFFSFLLFLFFFFFSSTVHPPPLPPLCSRSISHRSSTARAHTATHLLFPSSSLPHPHPSSSVGASSRAAPRLSATATLPPLPRRSIEWCGGCASLPIRAVCAVPHPPFTPSPLMRHPCTAAKDDTPNADTTAALPLSLQVPIPRALLLSFSLSLSLGILLPPSAALHTDVPLLLCLCVLLSTESTARTTRRSWLISLSFFLCGCFCCFSLICSVETSVDLRASLT